MRTQYYEAFTLESEYSTSAQLPELDLTIEWWQPGPFTWRPPTMTWKFCLWSFLHNAHLFPSRDFSVALVKAQGKIIHRFCLVPRYFRWPFTGKDDLVITSVWTDPAFRGQGIASWALSLAAHKYRKVGRVFWYLAREENAPSIAACRRAGFTQVAKAERVTRLQSSLLGKFRLVS